MPSHNETNIASGLFSYNRLFIRYRTFEGSLSWVRICFIMNWVIIATNAAGTPLSDTSPITIAKLSSSNS